MNNNKKDIEKLKRELLDYYGTASFNGFPVAITEIPNVENMPDEEVINAARKLGMV